MTALSGGGLSAILRERFDALAEIAGAAVSLKETRAILLGLFMDPSAPGMASLVETITQWAEFFVFTTVDTLASRAGATFTSCSRCRVTGTRRSEAPRPVLCRAGALDERPRALLFDLTNSFA